MPDNEKWVPPTEGAVAQPGQVVTPGLQQTATPQPAPIPEPQVAQQPVSAAPQPAAPQPEPTPVVSTPAPTVQPSDSPPVEQALSEQPVEIATPLEETTLSPLSDEVVTWTASEYVAHEKNTGWYFTLLVASLALAGFFYLITRDFVTSGVVILGALALGFYGARPPRQQTYQLDNKGLSIGQKQFTYEDFRTFAIVPEGAFSSIMLAPHRRFAPYITIYFAPDDEEKIANMLAGRLPQEEHRIDAVDKLMRRIRF